MAVDTKNDVYEFGSIRWAFESGNIARRVIQDIASGDYKNARSYYTYFRDKRYAHGAALRALKNAKKLIDVRCSFHDQGMIFAICWMSSLHEGKPVYYPMRHIGDKKHRGLVENDDSLEYWMDALPE